MISVLNRQTYSVNGYIQRYNFTYCSGFHPRNLSSQVCHRICEPQRDILRHTLFGWGHIFEHLGKTPILLDILNMLKRVYTRRKKDLVGRYFSLSNDYNYNIFRNLMILRSEKSGTQLDLNPLQAKNLMCL